VKLEKIISGGQTGVDQAALRAARKFGIATGGTAPCRFMTLAGPQRELLQGFGLVEGSAGYADRTVENVRDADATLRIASNFKSAGEKCTKLACLRYRKPYFNVLVEKGEVLYRLEARLALRAFLEQHSVRVLNVAGNSEQTSPGIGAIAEEFLIFSLR